MRSTLLFNHGWLFYPEKVGDNVPDSHFTPATLPHSNKTFSYHNFDNAEYQFISTYRKRFALPEGRDGRRVYLDFDGAMIATTVTINGHTFEEHKGGYTPFSFDITDYLRDNGENVLTVHVDSTERKDIPPYGHVIDYLLFGGIYRDVWLRYVEPVYIKDVFVKAFDVLTESQRVEVDVTLRNATDEQVEVEVDVYVPPTDETDHRSGKAVSVSVPARSEITETINITITNRLPLWSLDSPILCHCLALLKSTDKTLLDRQLIPFGMREAQFRDDGFYLNGERVQLRGLNRHQTFPYFGPAAPRRLQEKDADIIKYELGCNIVRTSHYPQSPHFLNRCDEIGLLVFEEIPGWQYIGDKDWQTLSIRDVRAMIERDRNHPSIVLWGVRINESFDNHDFYTATNQLARELDPTRQTGGVRNFRGSEWLEDVYTYNDFSNTILEPDQTPHLVTEFNGHMFPTKTWDNEERLVEHAIRHARIQSKAAMTGGVAGAIGWCAFDYNTHKEFGSGDRICYHGVMDIFRLPKWAAYFYGSQISPEQRIVMQAATLWTMGDRSEGGNNPLTIFSNCDEIEVFVGKGLIGRFRPDNDHYPNLPHPPFTVPLEMMWGSYFDDLRVVGYYKGQAVAEQNFPLNTRPTKLILQADDGELRANGMDMTRIVFKVVDQCGNVLHYSNMAITFEIDGPADFFGDNPFALVGGQAAVYIRARHEAGPVRITASASRLPSAELIINLV